MKNKHFTRKLLPVFLCLMLISFSAAAQSGDVPTEKIDLGVTSLNLAVGESYTFDVTIEPAEAIIQSLDWMVTDESVISIDPLTDTITALKEGEADLFAESIDQFSYAVCHVTVGDSVSKDVSVMKSGTDFLGLTPEETAKITGETFTRYMDFVADAAMNDAAFAHSAEKQFDVIAAVKPGTEEAQSQRALECGVESSYPLKELESVTLTGTFAAILDYVKGNEDLIEIFELGPIWVEQPVPENAFDEYDEESIEKTINLGNKGKVQELTNINFAQDKLRLNGNGRTIAILDTGINAANPAFTGKPGGKVIAEACFSNATAGTYSACNNGSTGAYASRPIASMVLNKAEFDHGSHVAGIAAGRNGIAPKANIISVNINSERRWQCTNADERKMYGCSAGCCKATILNSGQARGYDYILELVKKGYKIDVINMSYGDSGKYTSRKSADSQFAWKKTYYDKLIAQNIVLVAAAGNNHYNGYIGQPAALSNVIAVGALAGWKTPALTSFSNHSPLVDITAPGYEILSAGYSKESVYMSGTSMAAPMVSGAVALVKQMYPGMDVKDVNSFLKLVSNKSVNMRSDKKIKFPYSKPVLTFTNFLSRLSVPYYDRIVGGNNSVTIQLDRLALKNQGYFAKVTDLDGKAISDVRTQWRNEGNYTYVKVSSQNMINDRTYVINLTRTVKIGNQTYKATTREYGRPQAPRNLAKINVSAGDHLVKLSVNGFPAGYGVNYKIYDGKNLVAQFREKSFNKPVAYKGLTNGKVYTVTAQTYRVIEMTKGNQKSKIAFYGPESKPVAFMPMSQPLNATYSHKPKSTSYTVSCTADSAASGIRVSFKNPGDNAWRPGCRSSSQFSCTVSDTGIKTGTQFMVTKVKTVGKSTYVSPSKIVVVR